MLHLWVMGDYVGDLDLPGADLGRQLGQSGEVANITLPNITLHGHKGDPHVDHRSILLYCFFDELFFDESVGFDENENSDSTAQELLIQTPGVIGGGFVIRFRRDIQGDATTGGFDDRPVGDEIADHLGVGLERTIGTHQAEEALMMGFQTRRFVPQRRDVVGEAPEHRARRPHLHQVRQHLSNIIGKIFF